MKKSTLAILCILAFGMLYTQPAAAQNSSGAGLPEAPAAKTQTPASTSASPFKDEKQKASYALGMNWGNILRKQSVDIDPDTLMQGLKTAFAGDKTLLTDDEARAALTELEKESRARMEAKRQEEAAANQKEGDAFLAGNKSKEGVVALPSGLQYKIITPGTGPKPKANDTVTCNYKGTLLNGTEFDSSAKHGQPLTIEADRVIKGWTEALQLMPVGSKWQIFIPASLAYGERGTQDGTIPPNSTLIFEVELLSIHAKESPAGENPPASNPATTTAPTNTAPKDKPPTK